MTHRAFKPGDRVRLSYSVIPLIDRGQEQANLRGVVVGDEVVSKGGVVEVKVQWGDRGRNAWETTLDIVLADD